MASDQGAPVAAAGRGVLFGLVAAAGLGGAPQVLGLFDLRLEIEILLTVALVLGSLALSFRGEAIPSAAIWAVWATCVVAGVTGVALGVINGFEAPSIGEQIGEIRQREERSGKHVVEEPPASFQGRDSESRLIYFQERDLYQKVFGPGPPVPSDEIRIYDVRDGEVTEAFRFQPEGGRTSVFKIRFLGDVDNDGSDELIGGYGRPQDESEALLPFVVFWDDETSRYRITALQTVPPNAHTAVRPRRNARALRDAYRERVTFRDESEGLSITGYRAQDFTVTKEPARLISGLAVDIRTSSRPGKVELAVNQIRLSGTELKLVPCRFRNEAPLLAAWPNDRLLQFVLRERWLRERRNCEPILSD